MSLSPSFPSFHFLGRTLADYAASLDLDPRSLGGRRVLDVAAGPSSFAAEVVRLGADVIAVDPLYSRASSALGALARAELARLPSGRGLTAASASRGPSDEAAERFLVDYGQGRATGRYAVASLPELPFRNGIFDLVTCADFLFAGPAGRDPAFLREALRELVRVTRGEVRIHPLVDEHGQPAAGLERMLAQLRHVGVKSTIQLPPRSNAAPRDAILVLRRDP